MQLSTLNTSSPKVSQFYSCTFGFLNLQSRVLLNGLRYLVSFGTYKKSRVFMDSSLFHTDAQRDSWENIVNIETPVRRTAARMVGHVWPRLCWGKPHADVPRAS